VYKERGVHDGKLCEKLRDLHCYHAIARRCPAGVYPDDRAHCAVCRCGSKRAIVCGLGGDGRVYKERGVHDGKLCEKLRDVQWRCGVH
jgi:hypothetical protein